MTVMAVESNGLVKSFGDFRAVDGVDLEVRQGEIFGVLGPNGAGKTTCCGCLPPCFRSTPARRTCSASTWRGSRTVCGSWSA